mmetsp:Transcript_36459/g.82188  ORF Transcript_36459/g.82188 Transcript_36459/m.82188 type:complete len:484 (-) Transcript_36459:74-1525(-)
MDARLIEIGKSQTFVFAVGIFAGYTLKQLLKHLLSSSESSNSNGCENSVSALRWLYSMIGIDFLRFLPSIYFRKPISDSDSRQYILTQAFNAASAICPGARALGMVVCKGSELKIVHVNHRLRKMLGWGSEDVDSLPQTVHELLPPSMRRIHKEWVWHALNQGSLPGSLLHPLRNVGLQRLDGTIFQANVIIRTLGQDLHVGSNDCIFYAMIAPFEAREQEGGSPRESEMSVGLWHSAAEVLYGSSAGKIVASGLLPAPEEYSVATVLFLDIVGFTKKCTQLSPNEITIWMTQVHCKIENLIVKHHLRKIETRGDCYICASGTNSVEGDITEDQMSRMTAFAIDVANEMLSNGKTIIRVGIATGPITIAYIDSNQFAPTMCAFGDTMNTAARMEQSGSPGYLHLSEDAALRYCEELRVTSSPMKAGDSKDFGHNPSESIITPPWHVIDVKGKGQVRTAWIDCTTRQFAEMSESNPSHARLQGP